jgi:hypothetical protein
MTSGSEYVSYRLLHPSEDDAAFASVTPAQRQTSNPLKAARRVGLIAQAHARFLTHREFMRAAAYCWPAVQQIPRFR